MPRPVASGCQIFGHLMRECQASTEWRCSAASSGRLPVDFPAAMQRDAARDRTAQRSSPAVSSCHAQCGDVLFARFVGMACKRSGVQIPSAPLQVDGPFRARPHRNRIPDAADSQHTMNETCPHCLHEAHFNVPASASHGEELHQIHQCQACGKLVFRLLGPGSTVKALPGIRSPHPAVPAPIGADWYEAHLCTRIRAFRAAAAMARRTVQGVAIDQGAEGNTLNAQLKDLETKATLHPTLIECAHQPARQQRRSPGRGWA
jgi:hypothetical protein